MENNWIQKAKLLVGDQEAERWASLSPKDLCRLNANILSISHANLKMFHLKENPLIAQPFLSNSGEHLNLSIDLTVYLNGLGVLGSPVMMGDEMIIAKARKKLKGTLARKAGEEDVWKHVLGNPEIYSFWKSQ